MNVYETYSKLEGIPHINKYQLAKALHLVDKCKMYEAQLGMVDVELDILYETVSNRYSILQSLTESNKNNGILYNIINNKTPIIDAIVTTHEQIKSVHNEIIASTNSIIALLEDMKKINQTLSETTKEFFTLCDTLFKESMTI